MTALINEKFIIETLALRKQIEGAFLELGKRFQKIRDEKLFEIKYESFDEFLLDARMSSANASKLISIYQKFVVEYKIPEKKLVEVGSWSSLYSIIPHANTKQRAVDLVQKATLLTRDDLQKELSDEADGGKKNNCKHNDTYTVRICKDCGLRTKVYETN